MLDIEAVEFDAGGPGVAVLGLGEVPDLVVVHVDGEHRVLGLEHELLAEVGPDETAGPDHADGHGLDGAPVQVDSSRHCEGGTRSRGQGGTALPKS